MNGIHNDDAILPWEKNTLREKNILLIILTMQTPARSHNDDGFHGAAIERISGYTRMKSLVRSRWRGSFSTALHVPMQMASDVNDTSGVQAPVDGRTYIVHHFRCLGRCTILSTITIFTTLQHIHLRRSSISQGRINDHVRGGHGAASTD
mmetsp:Transcript_31227/g.75497  ORF Transcript_31227/g.75497 Transcript_31227/m.75497 type:complete len:150 (-) Transcript_31227:369-818(-)